jgi:hypothetical protein
MKPFVCIVAFMRTANSLHLSVTLPTAPLCAPMLKKAKLVELDFGYRAVSYDLTGEPNEGFKFNDTATALGRLIAPIREMTAQELTKFPEFQGWFVLENLEPSKVIEFLNVYGQIGLADYGRREKFNLPRTKTSQGLEVEQFCALVGVHHLSQIQKAKTYFKKNPEDLAKRILRIWWGTEVPMAWVERDIRELFKCVRILEILKNKKAQEFNLEQGPELRRLIHASDKAPFVIPFGKDSGNYRPTSDKWNLPIRHRQALVNDFASNVNRFLQPITRYPIRTEVVNEKNAQNCGIETFLIQSIFSTDTQFKEGLCKRPSCRRPYYKQRSTREFCSTSCATAQRVKKHRKEQKISAQKVRKKKTTVKKGKNG